MSLTTVEFLQKLRQFVEREALVRDNTRKLYMAATSAGQLLTPPAPAAITE